MVWVGYFRGAASFGEDKQQSYHAGTRICPSHTRVLLGSAVTYAAGNSTRGGVVFKGHFTPIQDNCRRPQRAGVHYNKGKVLAYVYPRRTPWINV